MELSCECEELIEELEEDIKEFGENEEMYAFFEEINGLFILTNYDFIVEERPLTSIEIGNAMVCVMKAKEILKILKKQNSVI